MTPIRSMLHIVRDRALPLAAHRAFQPIANPKRRILLVRPDHFGDLLLLTPALRNLRHLAVDDEIILMTGPWNAHSAERIADVDRVVTFPFPGFTRAADGSGAIAPYRAIGDAAAILRELEPRAVVLLRDDHWWGAWMAREAGVPLRFGYDHPRLRPFLTHPMELGSRHYVEQNSELIERALAVLGYLPGSPDNRDLSLYWPSDPAAEDEARELLEAEGITGSYLVVHPGAGVPVKRWPNRRWAHVIDELAGRDGCQVVLTGSRDERQITSEISDLATTPCVDLSGKTTLAALAEVFRRANLVLGVDSGPLHLAAAVGTPSVHVFGPSDRVRYGPWGDPGRHRVVSAGMCCPRCGDLDPTRAEGCGCMVAVNSEQVVAAAVEVVANDR